MDKKEVDIARTTRTVRVRPEKSLLRRALYSSQSGPCANCASADPFAQRLPSEVLHSVRETAQRLLLVQDGAFERSPGQRLVADITDDLLIETRQAVINAGDAVAPKPLCLAWRYKC